MSHPSTILYTRACAAMTRNAEVACGPARYENFDQIQEFVKAGLGFAPHEWSILSDHVLDTKKDNKGLNEYLMKNVISDLERSGVQVLHKFGCALVPRDSKTLRLASFLGHESRVKFLEDQIATMFPA